MSTDLRNAWNRRAAAWVEWARDPELDDDFWSFHLEAFISLVPEPGTLTLDLAAGEGRVTRELQQRGHTVIGVDSSPALTRAAVEHADAAPAVVGDATKLPLRNGCVDLVVAFMCLHDFDDLVAAGAEMKRVLRKDGMLLIALLHPFVTGTLVDSYSSDATYESLEGGQGDGVSRSPSAAWRVPVSPRRTGFPALQLARSRRPPNDSAHRQVHPHGRLNERSDAVIDVPFSAGCAAG